ncbi:MAG: macro domain-containing protein [Nitrospinae bacterium]|nr:macro domain-containing protein [Nitrospinota bacterium]
MINLKPGDILKEDVEALVNTVNCAGIMGRGIALQFRKAFPENFKAYQAACKRKEVKPGNMFIYNTGSLYNPRYIINFPTKRHWKGKSRMEDIQAGLKSLVREVRDREISSIAIPPLGCGLGGLDWAEVRREIESAFNDLPNIQVFLFEPVGAPTAEKIAKARQAPNTTVGRASLIGLMRRYLAAVMDPWVTLLEVQKLMYFMQEAGEPLRLRYAKALYGPYADNLGHVLDRIEGHYTSGYLDGGDNPEKPLELKIEAVAIAEKFLEGHPATRSRFDRVTDLIQGFETPYGMELLSTVHWVMTREGASDDNEVASKVYSWNDRKKMFPEKHIRIVIEVLRKKGWLDDGQGKRPRLN